MNLAVLRENALKRTKTLLGEENVEEAFLAGNVNVAVQVCPLLTALLTPKVAQQLVKSAGSLQKLAFMPSSKVLVLGAETAFFRGLKEGKKKVVIGLIGQNTTSTSQARKLAAKAVIAARQDYFAKNNKKSGA